MGRCSRRQNFSVVSGISLEQKGIPDAANRANSSQQNSSIKEAVEVLGRLLEYEALLVLCSLVKT